MKVFIYFRFLAVGYRNLRILPVSSMLAILAAIIEVILPFWGGSGAVGQTLFTSPTI